MKPIVMISSWSPRLCGIATFAEEAVEFIRRANPFRNVVIICHVDGQGREVFPIIDMSREDWWEPVAQKVHSLDPYVVHIQHEYGLYEHCDDQGVGDGNAGFLKLLEAIHDCPTVIEPHTIHGRLRDREAEFIRQLCEKSNIVLFKCHYQKWRLDWTFAGRGWETPRNIMVIPHGARPDRRWKLHEIPGLRRALGLDKLGLSPHLVGMIGWIQANKRWDILLSMWEDVHEEIRRKCGQKWDLLAAGTMRDPNDQKKYDQWKSDILALKKKGVAQYYEFIPRGEIYYKMMAICDFVVLPSTDETQSGTLARIIALNKPYITTAPMEGLTSQTLESEGGLLFTDKNMLKEKVIRLACDEGLRLRLGENLKNYLETVISWEIVARQYKQAYELAHEANRTGESVALDLEF